MPPTTRTRLLAWAATGGVLLGVLYTVSPLTFWVVLCLPVLGHLAGWQLSDRERRVVLGVVGVALGLRALALLVLYVAGIPWHNDLAVGALTGDEAYNLSRALRTRDVGLGLATTRYDYFVVYDEYGRSSYLDLLAGLQLAFGPTPYSARLLNAVLFIAGSLLLFRQAHRAYSFVPAVGALAVLLAMPSLFHTSISLLKESLYFFLTALLLTAVLEIVRARSWRSVATWLIVSAVSLWLLDDLRRGATTLALTGIGAGLAFRIVALRRSTAIAAAALAVAGLLALVSVPGLHQPVQRGLDQAARQHTGHVFTVGNAYKLLDDGFYMRPGTPSASSITLTPDQALRYLVRSAASFVFTPLPWEVISLRQALFLPEHLVWYVMLALLPVGLVAGWQRDPVTTSVLAGYAVVTASVVALTTGNVGTLVRLRGLVTPYVLWMVVLGACVTIEALLHSRGKPTAQGAGPTWRAR
jgi:hypothetical protein